MTAVKEGVRHAAVSCLDCVYVCVFVCVFLQQVDTDEPVFTMTEHLFPLLASTVSSHITCESALLSKAFLNHQQPNDLLFCRAER